MGKFVHLAREFFNEGEMRDLFSAESFFSTGALYKIARSRGIFLSETLSREELVNELSRHWYSWRQFIKIVQTLNSDDPEEKTSVLRIENSVTYDEINKAKQLLDSKRGERKKETYSITKVSKTKIRIVVNYIDRDPTKAKGLQRQEKTSLIDIDLNEDRAEILHGRDDRSTEIAFQLLSCLREGRKSPDEIIERTISLRTVSTPTGRTKFFTDLIALVNGCILLKVKDVRLEQFKAPQEEIDDDEGSDEEGSASELEKETAGKIQTALLRGDDVLVTTLFEELSNSGYFVSYMKWEVRERGGSERRIVLEAGFRNPQKGQEFFFDAKKYYEKDDFGDDTQTAKTTKALDRARFRRLIADAAYCALSAIQQSPNQEEK